MHRRLVAPLAVLAALSPLFAAVPASAAVAQVVLVGGTAVVSEGVADEVSGTGATARRLAGENRYDTAARVAVDVFVSPVPVVYLASGRNFPDALAAGALAGAQGGPVLLVHGVALPRPVADALTRLRPSRVVVVGGESAVPASIVSAVAELGLPTPTRVAGADRYETSTALAQAGYPAGSQTVFLASGQNFPDALAAAPVAAARRAPVLLTDPATLSPSAAAELARLAPAEVVVVGGPVALSDAALEQVRSAVPTATVRRIAGADRYETAALLARQFLPAADVVYLASGLVFPDALVAAPAAAAQGAPVLLTRPDGLPTPVRDFLPQVGVPTPPSSPAPPLPFVVELPVLPAGKTAADYPQTTTTELIAAVRADAVAATPALPSPSPLLPASFSDPQPTPTWAVPDPAWSSRACAALLGSGVLSLVDASWDVYQDDTEESGTSCHVESTHRRTRVVLLASAPGADEDLSGLDENPDYTRSRFGTVTVYVSSTYSAVGPVAGVGGAVGYASTADGTFLSVLFVDGDFRRLGGRDPLITAVVATVADRLGR